MEFQVVQGLANAPQAKAIREAVFVEEQGFTPSLEFDGYDEQALHITGFVAGAAVCTARIFAEEGAPAGILHVGRVCVLQQARGKGMGALLMQQVATTARQAGATMLELGAQTYATPFYEKLGYTTYGEVFFDEEVPHILMRKSL
ncbi:GNAT family N-acetyltransferase [Ruminococcaceae bacterium OttesenSCG-928-N02]|nr:GNAT family N-acetyltransferase [Ruminococcaceae bacterium OttesenSCG-928-N02]